MVYSRLSSVRKSAPEKTVVWAKMGSVVFVLHLVILSPFFMRNQQGAHIQFMVPAHVSGEIPIVFVTMPSPAPTARAALSVVQSGATQKQSSACAVVEKKAAQKEVNKKEVVAKNSKKEPVKKAEKAAAKPKELLAQRNTKKEAAEKPNNSIAIELSKDARHLADEYQQLYALLQEQWAPPDGMQACSCVIQCSVDWNGTIEKLEIAEPSGMLMFDLSARNTVAQLTLPKWTKGKSIAITFVA